MTYGSAGPVQPNATVPFFTHGSQPADTVYRGKRDTDASAAAFSTDMANFHHLQALDRDNMRSSSVQPPTRAEINESLRVVADQVDVNARMASDWNAEYTRLGTSLMRQWNLVSNGSTPEEQKQQHAALLHIFSKIKAHVKGGPGQYASFLSGVPGRTQPATSSDKPVTRETICESLKNVANQLYVYNFMMKAWETERQQLSTKLTHLQTLIRQEGNTSDEQKQLHDMLLQTSNALKAHIEKGPHMYSEKFSYFLFRKVECGIPAVQNQLETS